MSRALIAIRLLHTVVWAAFVACIVSIYVFAAAGRFRLALAAIAVVLVEVVVLVLNRMTCPLTPLAARHTDDRRPNFDIYLPEWLARRNKEVFGGLYVVGVLLTLALWLRSR